MKMKSRICTNLARKYYIPMKEPCNSLQLAKSLGKSRINGVNGKYAALHELTVNDSRMSRQM